MSNLLRHPAIDLIREALRQDWRRQWVSALILLALSLASAYWIGGDSPVLIVLCLGVAAIALLLLIRLRNNADIRKHPLLQILREDPAQIVWVYGMATQWMPFGIEVRNSGLLYIKLIDGQEFCLSLAHDKLKLVSRTLRRMLPRAVFGYSEERAEQFRSDPTRMV